MRIAAIILMGGSGERFGHSQPKQFHSLSGKPLYRHTLNKFCHFDQVVLVCPKEWIGRIGELPPNVKCTVGGRTRQESSYAGLKATSADYVVIHDGVRPFVSQEIIQANVEAVLQYDAVDTCIPSADTIVKRGSGSKISAIPPREEYLRGQTPQSFKRSLLLEAHEKAESQNASDDCQLVLALGHPVHIVKGSDENIKITTPLDLFLAEQLMKEEPLSLASEESLQGKKIIVTGGGSGIGAAVCEELIREGAVPLVISRSSSAYPADLSSPTESREAFAKITLEHGAVDGLIHCVGALKMGKLEELSLTEIEEILSVNFKSAVFAAKFADLKEGAHLINLSSSSFSRGRPGYSIYSAAKAAVVNFSQGLAEERPDLHVHVCVPARTNTPLRRVNFPDEDVETLLTPKEVAEQVLLALRSKNLTGTIWTKKRS